MATSVELIGTTEYRTLQTRCRINRCRYNLIWPYLSKVLINKLIKLLADASIFLFWWCKRHRPCFGIYAARVSKAANLLHAFLSLPTDYQIPDCWCCRYGYFFLAMSSDFLPISQQLKFRYFFFLLLKCELPSWNEGRAVWEEMGWR
jgi:hypothetical protein